MIDKVCKTVFAMAGLDVRWIKNVRAFEQREWEDQWAESYRVLHDAQIRTVLDIGANEGQFAKMIVRACPHLQALHSFEPLADCQSPLRRALEGDTRHLIHNFGIGDKNESTSFNHAEFSPCSSLLMARPLLTQDHPGAGKIRQEIVELRTLDSWATETELVPEILIKIDVQGYEDKVIEGGVNTLKRARYVVVEVPFFQLYENQPLFHQIYSKLHDLGFVFRGFVGQNVRKFDARVLEADALFENSTLAGVNRD